MPGYRRSKVGFLALGICLVALVTAVNVGWIVLNWRTGLLLVSGVLVFAFILTGVVLNTIFLLREIRRNERHDAFINAVTHELKTPIASIQLYLETLESRPLDEPKRQDFYRIMREDCTRLLSTVEQVLRAGQTAPRKRVTRERVDLPQLVADCVALARTRHHLGPEEVAFLREPEPVVILGEPDELRAAVTNLLDNAIKYSGQKLHVEVSCHRENSKYVFLRVRDQGAGISPDQLKRIFGRFYRIPDVVSRRVKGTGLGLFIVRSVARRHGGKAYAESAGLGFGSTFTLQLPAAPRT